MSQIQSTSRARSPKAEQNFSGWIIALLTIFVFLVVGSYLASPFSAGVRQSAVDLLALDSAKTTWYITRSAGITAYSLLWLSTVLGLVIPTKLFNNMLVGNHRFDFHEFISLLALGFTALHIFILLADQYMPFTLTQIFFPFLSPFKPFWVGIGVISLYILILVTGTFYIRKWIGMKTFKLIHVTSLLGYLGATAHGFFAGTDSALPIAKMMYGGTFLVVVFLTVYWLALGAQKKMVPARSR